MMRVANAMVLALLLGLSACSTKDVRVGGTMCPEGSVVTPGTDPQRQECTFYGPAQEKAAAEAAYPKGTTPESEKTLEEQGYKITE